MTHTRNIEVFQYVPHHEVEQRHREGWEMVNDMQDCHHGRHAVLMRRPEPAEIDYERLAREQGEALINASQAMSIQHAALKAADDALSLAVKSHKELLLLLAGSLVANVLFTLSLVIR